MLLMAGFLVCWKTVTSIKFTTRIVGGFPIRVPDLPNSLVGQPAPLPVMSSSPSPLPGLACLEVSKGRTCLVAAPVPVSPALPLAPLSGSFSGKKVVTTVPKRVRTAERALLISQTAPAGTCYLNSRSIGTASAIRYASLLAWMSDSITEVGLASHAGVPKMADSIMTNCSGARFSPKADAQGQPSSLAFQISV